jgi:hypothetical protein
VTLSKKLRSAAARTRTWGTVASTRGRSGVGGLQRVGGGLRGGEQGRAATAAAEAAPGSVGTGGGVQATRGQHAWQAWASCGARRACGRRWTSYAPLSRARAAGTTVPPRQASFAQRATQEPCALWGRRRQGRGSHRLRHERHLLRRFRCRCLNHRASTAGSMGAGAAASAFSLPRR